MNIFSTALLVLIAPNSVSAKEIHKQQNTAYNQNSKQKPRINPPLPLLDPFLQPKFVNPLPNPLSDAFIFKPQKQKHCDFYELQEVPLIADLCLIDPLT
mgnify:CR=1 FL=1